MATPLLYPSKSQALLYALLFPGYVIFILCRITVWLCYVVPLCFDYPVPVNNIVIIRTILIVFTGAVVVS